MNINSHVQLPNCVLRNFRDETDPEKKVWYLDVQTGDILRKSSKKLGTCKGYYSETGERFWAENIENPLSIITHRIQKYCTGEIPCLQISAEDVYKRQDSDSAETRQAPHLDHHTGKLLQLPAAGSGLRCGWGTAAFFHIQTSFIPPFPRPRAMDRPAMYSSCLLYTS